MKKITILIATLLLITTMSLKAQMVLNYNTNLSTGTTITLPLYGTVNVTVDWGDGSTENITSEGALNHTYATNGTYTVQITGSLTNYGTYIISNDKLTGVTSWGSLGLISLNYAFYNAINLTQVPTDFPSTVTTAKNMFFNAENFNGDISAWDVSNVTDMGSMFSGATIFNQNIGAWDVSSVTNMYRMIYNCSAFNQDLSGWNVSNVTSMNSMFYNDVNFNSDLSNWNVANVTTFGGMFAEASSFNSDLSNWDVSSATTISAMFSNASSFNSDISNWNVSNVTSMSTTFYGAVNFNSNISNWNVSNVTNMYEMFYGATNFDSDISSWDVSNVTNMYGMFSDATNFNSNISNWNVSNVTDMQYMFSDAENFSSDISSWNVSNVTTMKAMFAGATNFNSDISNWNVSNVTDFSSMFSTTQNFNSDLSTWDISNATKISGMFYKSTIFNQDISSWDVSNVTTMSSMFYQATSFDQDLSSWNVSNVTNMTNMFYRATLSTTNYDALLISWAAQTLQNNISFHGGYSKYSCTTTDTRQSIIDTYNWTISDGGVVADNTNPTLTVQNYTLNLDVTGNATLLPNNVVTSASDNCAIADTTLSQTTFDCSNIGTNNVSVTLTDESGNTTEQTVTITVVDNTNPTLTVQNYTLELDATGNATLQPNNVVTNANDNCVIDTTLSQTAFDCSDIGTPVTIDVTASDATGNNVVQQAIITVVDNVNPVLTVQNYTLELDITGNAVLLLNDVVTGASDNCTIADTTLSQTTFDCSNIGTNNISVILTDASGNTTEQTATITVVDNINPTLTVQNYTLELDVTGNAVLTPNNVVTSANDNCVIDTILSQTTFDCSDIGTPITVDVTISDATGNTDVQQAIITVVDNVNPIFTVQNYTLELDTTASTVLLAGNIITNATDNCAIADTALSQTTFDCSNIGNPVSVNVTLTDVSGNTNIQQAIITVVDNIEPKIVCLGNQVVNLQAGQTEYTVNGNEFNPVTFSDNCGVANVENDFNNSVTLADAVLPIGTTTITWTITDINGNTNTCSFDIQVDEYLNVSTVNNSSNISIYPNPAHNKITIESNEAINSIKILDITGKTVLTPHQGFKTLDNVDISTLQNGVYFIKINNTKTIKIIKE